MIGNSFSKNVANSRKAHLAVKSAYEDLRERTLDKIGGMWGKLDYLASRRTADGNYQHWGFERAHGKESAQGAFAQAHHSLIQTILQTRLRPLREDLQLTSTRAGASPFSYLSKLKASLPHLLPSGCSKVSERHLLSILKTLAALEVHPQPAAQFSWQHPPPGQSLQPPEDV
jgi:hypothetical protein